MHRLPVILLVLAAALLLGARDVSAQDPSSTSLPSGSEVDRAQRFRQLIEQATADFKAGNYDQAIEKYSGAYALRRRPPLLFNIAQVHRKAGRTAEALKFYEDFLREDPQSELAPEVQTYVKALRNSDQSTREVNDAPTATAAPTDNFLGSQEDRLRLFRQHIDTAAVKTKAGDYEAAAGEYWSAYALKPQKIIIFNVAQSFRKAGRWAEALTLFQRYLRDEPGSPLTGEVEAYISEAQARLRQQQIDADRQTAERLASANAALAERLVEIREIDRRIVAQTAMVPPKPPPKPIYRRPWFWVLIGSAAVGAAVGIGLGVALAPRLPDADLGRAVIQF